jgi:diguanylate cyclase (GGDEF)-like protein/PAS domain S-box-containing protein
MVLVIGVLGSIVGSGFWAGRARHDRAAVLTEQAREVSDTVAGVLERDIDVTDGAKTLVSVDPSVGAAEFQRWFDLEEGSGRYPGVEEFGYSEIVPARDVAKVFPALLKKLAAQAADLSKAERARLAADSSVLLPPGQPSYLIPMASAGDEADLVRLESPAYLKLDAFATPSGPLLHYAGDSGQIVAVSTGMADQFEFAVPLYRTGAVPATPAGRKAQFGGVMGAVVNGSQVLRSALGPFPNTYLRLWRLEPGHAPQLIASAGAVRTSQGSDRTIALDADGSWLVEVAGPAAGTSPITQQLGVLGGGLIVTLLLFALVWVLGRSRERALRLVSERTSELSRSEERFRSLATSSPIGILQTDIDGTYQYGNGRLAELLGRDEPELQGHGWLQAFTNPDAERVRTLLATESARLEGIEARVSDNPERWVRICAALLTDNGQPSGYVSSLEDVTMQLQIQNRLHSEARHDHLTGLPNRLAFLETLRSALSTEGTSPVAVFFVDLDRFKQVNDALGHRAGDELLTLCAQRFSACMGPNDQIARLGGDEFAMMLPASDRERVVDVVSGLQAAVAEPFPVAGTEVVIGASIGVVIVDDPHDDPAAILQDADMAMYRAKGGSTRYELFEPSMRASTVNRIETERALRGAIERRQIKVVYQPILDLATGRTIAAEALVRWDHPTRGLLSPADFLPIAESTGLIVPIGDIVLQDAIATIASLPEGFAVSVNLSAQQLAHSTVLSSLPTLLRDRGLNPDRLWVEVLETHVLDQQNKTVIRELSRAGIRIAIDDFGTGYGSLLYLRDLEVDVIKIDRSFITGLSQNLSDRAIVAALVGLAHHLGIKVVGEGVETVAECELLRSTGADLAQGWLWAPGITAAELLARTQSEQQLLTPAV